MTPGAIFQFIEKLLDASVDFNMLITPLTIRSEIRPGTKAIMMTMQQNNQGIATRHATGGAVALLGLLLGLLLIGSPGARGLVC